MVRFNFSIGPSYSSCPISVLQIMYLLDLFFFCRQDLSSLEGGKRRVTSVWCMQQSLVVKTDNPYLKPFNENQRKLLASDCDS